MKQREAILYAHHRITKGARIIKTLLERVEQLERDAESSAMVRETLLEIMNSQDDRIRELERQVLYQDAPTTAPIDAEATKNNA